MKALALVLLQGAKFFLVKDLNKVKNVFRGFRETFNKARNFHSHGCQGAQRDMDKLPLYGRKCFSLIYLSGGREALISNGGGNGLNTYHRPEPLYYQHNLMHLIF